MRLERGVTWLSRPRPISGRGCSHWQHCGRDYRVGLADQCARYRTGPRSASTERRSPSTAALSTFRVASALPSSMRWAVSLAGRACRRSPSATQRFAAANANLTTIHNDLRGVANIHELSRRHPRVDHDGNVVCLSSDRSVEGGTKREWVTVALAAACFEVLSPSVIWAQAQDCPSY